MKKFPKPTVDELRQTIKAKSIIHKLTINALAPHEVMTPSQVASAKILLNKLIPDLKAVEFTGLPNGGLPQEIQINIVQAEQSALEHQENELDDIVEIVDPLGINQDVNAD